MLKEIKPYRFTREAYYRLADIGILHEDSGVELIYGEIMVKHPYPGQSKKYKFTREEYHKMAEAGILLEDARIELIRGEIIEMSPVSMKHMLTVSRIAEWFTVNMHDKVFVSTQNPIQLPDQTEPEPDVILLDRGVLQKETIPNIDDVFLVMEVSRSTLEYDRKVKLPIYAAGGISEVWIVNLVDDVVEVCRQPDGDIYKMKLTLTAGDTVTPLFESETSVVVSEMLGL